LFANFTRTFTRISNQLDSDQNGSGISFVPDYVGNAGVNLRLPKTLVVSPYLHVVGTYYDSTSRSGRQAFGPYQILNVRVEKQLFRTDESSLFLFTDLNNVTNRKFAMPWQFQDPGFNIFGGIETRF
jgi:hypothetical protein